jgi:ABC-2 type transport system permease protein
MNLFLIPMWLLSGAFFPVDGAPGWLRSAMAVNPLTYGVAALRRALGGAAPAWTSPSLSFAVTAGFAIVMFAAAVAVVARFPAGPGPGRRLALARPPEAP